MSQSDADAELRRAFDMFDLDKNGFISKNELTIVMEKIGEELTSVEIDAMMDDADADNDGQVSWEEFKVMVTKIHDDQEL